VNHEGHRITFTVSLGISQANNDISDYREWLEQADQALYAAKEGGRNQTVVYSQITK